MSRKKKLFGTAIALGAALMMSACSNGAGDAADAAKGSEGNPIKIGVVGASDPQWPLFEAAAEKEGIYVDLVNFTDYPNINTALTDGELDLNQFQHIQYLAAYNVNSNEDLTPIGATAIYPMGVYSNQYSSLEEIPQGGEVTVPNDATNQSRAIQLLADAGLVTLVDNPPAVLAPTSIDEANSKVKVTPVDANNVVTAIDSVAATVVNNDYLKDAGLKATDAIYLESADSEGAAPYINIWVARAEDAHNETYLKLVEINKQQEILDAIQDNSDGSAIFSDATPAELADILADQQKLVTE
ncbi:MAG: MetQ/NlpA family ABC transporter substrate-binding protein [Actinomycetaceae bacterium]|nr:MetQ/NlpA family ABC transporter substrate-binding protein [Arcanobacterium sp.]MDD7504894.1 MetQ/NlpA family ABC transporter substrate-binding protein [Actinomycetaceae bacterium]MDY6142730.1 MetQ/NlpA family ABC transporter substrate-binding protein [Arcanobacterium sp.]